jgi:hypothetical protein
MLLLTSIICQVLFFRLVFQQHHFLSARAALVAGEPEVVDARRDLAGVRLPIAVGIAERDVGARMDHHLPDRLAVRGVDGPGRLDGNRVGGLPKTGLAPPLSMNQ